MASGAVHFTGKREPCFGQYSSSAITRAKPKSDDKTVDYASNLTHFSRKFLTHRKSLRYYSLQLERFVRLNLCVLIASSPSTPCPKRFETQCRSNLRTVRGALHLRAENRAGFLWPCTLAQCISAPPLNRPRIKQLNDCVGTSSWSQLPARMPESTLCLLSKSSLRHQCCCATFRKTLHRSYRDPVFE